MSTLVWRHTGQSTEANIFIWAYKRIPDDKFALIIHDSILTTEKDVLLSKKLLEDRVRKLFSGVILKHHNLDKLFKTSMVSIPDELLEKTQRDAYFKEEYENGIDIWFWKHFNLQMSVNSLPKKYLNLYSSLKILSNSVSF